MKATGKRFKNIDDYLAAFPKEVGQKLQIIREIVHKIAPEAVEVINYNMPAFKLDGILVYFAAYKNHIGLYPGASSILFFSKDLAGHKTSKGTVQFPLDKKIPVSLVRRIVKYRVREKLAKQKQGKNN
jgi:uncharacterized protein YdhG (YjbR/CyaY superfamily)